MSRGKPDRKPLIALVHNADRAFQAHMVGSAHERGRPDIKPAHNSSSRILGDDARARRRPRGGAPGSPGSRWAR